MNIILDCEPKLLFIRGCNLHLIKNDNLKTCLFSSGFAFSLKCSSLY